MKRQMANKNQKSKSKHMYSKSRTWIPFKRESKIIKKAATHLHEFVFGTMSNWRETKKCLQTAAPDNSFVNDFYSCCNDSLGFVNGSCSLFTDLCCIVNDAYSFF